MIRQNEISKIAGSHELERTNTKKTHIEGREAEQGRESARTTEMECGDTHTHTAKNIYTLTSHVADHGHVIIIHGLHLFRLFLFLRQVSLDALHLLRGNLCVFVRV